MPTHRDDRVCRVAFLALAILLAGCAGGAPEPTTTAQGTTAAAPTTTSGAGTPSESPSTTPAATTAGSDTTTELTTDDRYPPPELKLQAADDLALRVVAFGPNRTAREYQEVANETFSLDGGETVTVGPDLASDPHRFAVYANGTLAWNETMEQGEYVRATVFPDGNVTIQNRAIA